MIRRILKNTAIKFVKFNFKILINQVIKDKAVMPHKVVDEMYEIFDNINENKFFDKKITLPYEGVSILNRINCLVPQSYGWGLL
mgnify:FL=1